MSAWLLEWWANLDTSLQVYYAIAIISTGLLLIQMVLLLVGAGLHDIADVFDVETDLSDGMHVLSLRTVIAFFLGLGWTGVICLRAGMGNVPALLLGCLVGVILLAMVYFIMRSFARLAESGNISLVNAVGSVGSVYLPIPPARSGSGKIQITVQNRTREVDALTNHSERIGNQSRVRVTELLDEDTFLVEPLDLQR